MSYFHKKITEAYASQTDRLKLLVFYYQLPDFQQFPIVAFQPSPVFYIETADFKLKSAKMFVRNFF